jgi:hypothetical protein
MSVALESASVPNRERHVHALRHQVLAPVVQHQFDLQRRVAIEKGFESRNDEPYREARPDAHSQQPPQLAGASRRVLRFVEIGQNRLDPGQKVGADVGEDDRARGADEQRRADVTLERRDRA